MNNLIPFKLKMLILLTFCAFMTFSMLIYFVKLTEKCDNSINDETCIQVSKNPVFKASYVFHNLQNKATASGNELVKLGLSTNKKFTSYGKQSQNRDETTAKRKVFSYEIGLTAAVSSDQPDPNMKSSEKPEKTDFSRIENKSLKMVNKSYHETNSNSKYEVYKKRRLTLQQLCPKYLDLTRAQKIKKTKLNHILIDETHKILYCYVPKVACTNWKRIFLVLTGKAKNISEVTNLPASQIHTKNLFKTLEDYTVAKIVNMTEEYKKFIFVRHPFERLLSAYRNKLEQHYDSSKYFQARFGKYIIKNYRKNPTNLSLAKGDDVTFDEFVRYIVSSNPRHYNEHWQRVTDLCHPCLIRYDFIGKYETLQEDSNYLLRQFGMEFDFPLMSKPSTTSSNLKKYYDPLGRAAIYKLFKIYEMDFRLFGYDLSGLLDVETSTSIR